MAHSIGDAVSALERLARIAREQKLSEATVCSDGVSLSVKVSDMAHIGTLSTVDVPPERPDPLDELNRRMDQGMKRSASMRDE